MSGDKKPVSQKFSLSADEIQTFNDNGFIGPFDIYDSEDVVTRWREERVKLAFSKNKPHQSKTINYDRHLDNDFLSQHIARPEIVHRLNSLMGQDVMCWRTEMFPKYPSEDGTGWHQVETFQVGESLKPALKFDKTAHDKGLFNELTVWSTFSDAQMEHGCMQFLKGSHKQWYYDENKKITHNPTSKKNNFFGYDYTELKLDKDWEPEKEDVCPLPMRAGQFVIFTAKCVHGSLPNTSDQMRMAFSSRYVPPSVKVYDGIESLDEFGGEISLDYFGCVQVSGEDKFDINRKHEKNFNGIPFREVELV